MSDHSPTTNEQTSATGGSASSQAVDLAAHRWQARPIVGAVLHAVAVFAPVVAALFATDLVVSGLPEPQGLVDVVALLAIALFAAIVVIRVVDGVTRQLMPIAALYRLSLAFPDAAPSRFRTALRTNTGHRLDRAVAAGGADAGTALLVELLRRLNKHDRLTRGHTERVRAYSHLIGVEMGLPPDDLDRLNWAALLHDVGKLEVPRTLLNKRGRPTQAEWRVLRGHPAAARRYVEPLRGWLGPWVLAAEQHHERWDGAGYPDGLAGTDISIAGRIVAVADAFDTMVSTRSYKPALPMAQARAELADNAGTQFDPEVVRALLALSLGRGQWYRAPLVWLSQVPALLHVGSVAGAASVATGAAVAVGAIAAPDLVELPIGLERPTISEEVTLGAEGEIAPPTTTAERTAVSTTVAPPAFIDASTTTLAAGPSVPGTAVTTTVAVTVTTSTAPGSTPAPTGRPTTTTIVSTSTTVAATTTTTSSGVTTTTSPATTTAPTTTTSVPSTIVAAPDSASAVGPAPVVIDVLANDSSAGDPIDPSSLAIETPPPSGTAQVTGSPQARRIRYQPANGQVGSVEFTYRVCTSAGSCATAAVTVEVDNP